MKKWCTLLFLLSSLLIFSLTTAFAATAAPEATPRPYERIVILSDAHYPSKTPALKNPAKFMDRLDNKWKALDKVNSWPDVDLVVFTGDLVAQTPDKTTLGDVKQFVSAVKKPVAIIAGNHELYYQEKMRNGKKHRASFAEQQQNLYNFCQTFGMDSPYYMKEMGNYVLLFLSPEPATGNYGTKLSPIQLHWLDSTLSAYRDKAAIIFFHAPLNGTLANYTQEPDKPSYCAEPWEQLEDILLSQPQVQLWVSGHTHTPATDPSFASKVNWYDGHILDVHNPTMDAKTIWINSLYLYPDKIIIKTFNTKTNTFMDELTRTIDVKARMAEARQNHISALTFS